nr:MAG TPA: hypothetical protein [Caudoviricetes sp.]
MRTGIAVIINRQSETVPFKPRKEEQPLQVLL